jgi:hypothetical protein
MCNVLVGCTFESYIIDKSLTIWHCFVCRNFDRNAFNGVLNMTINTSLTGTTLFSIVENKISELMPSWDSGKYTPVL